MEESDDLKLLRDYAKADDEAAFAKLVSRHLGFVYSLALRQVNNPDLAVEITQAVFTLLAQKAGQLSRDTLLVGWLFKTTRFVALAQIRTEAKRRQREQEVLMQNDLQNQGEPSALDEAWQKLTPLLDDALASLGEKDRQAVLLRFFENRSLAEVGNQLGMGEDTARKRVSRALVKLNGYFSSHGVPTTTAIIAMGIPVNIVQLAPAGLAKTVTGVAVAKSAAASSSTLTLIKGALKIMAWTKAKTTLIVGVSLLVATGTATVAVKTILTPDDSWRTDRFLETPFLETAAPQVWIKPAKLSGEHGGGGSQGRGDKRRGILMEAAKIVFMAYDFRNQGRVVYAVKNAPQRLEKSYDFIASLKSGNEAALQKEVRKTLGVVARREVIETNVLLLTLKVPNAEGLSPSAPQGRTTIGDTNFIGVGLTISNLIMSLEQYLRVPVIDKTGLSGDYDINFSWTLPSWKDPDHSDLKQAMLSQLGLELIPGREPVEMLIIEDAK